LGIWAGRGGKRIAKAIPTTFTAAAIQIEER
jgi:hypothetical protein